MVQFLEPETDVMVQFLAPEIVIMGERNFMDVAKMWLIYLVKMWLLCGYYVAKMRLRYG